MRRSRLATQGTLNAARFALEDGLGGNLAGGTHHALWEGGEGYCVINDVGVAVRHLQSTGEAMRVLVVDLDVHHGNANAALFADDERVFTFSMHGARNFPLINHVITHRVGSRLQLALVQSTTSTSTSVVLRRR